MEGIVMDRETLKEYLGKLNPEQYKAATYVNGSCLVLAAAGSGKTSTLISRIAFLIGLQNILPHNILAVTFTNKAAREMNSRLFRMGLDTQQLWIGTFHGICNKILRCHAKEAGLKKNFYIMDQQEQLSFLKRTLRAHQYDPKTINVNDLQDKINGYKEVGWRSTQLRTGSQERKFYEFYEEACLQDNCVDFAELLLGCYELFTKNPAIEEHYAEKFKHILVDEFQDTNELQYKWLKKLGAIHQNVFAVGDDDQCFPKGTTISTIEGKKPIEQINIGEYVISKNNKDTINGKVINKYEKIVNKSFVKIILEKDLFVESTAEHIYFVKSRGNKYNTELYTHECTLYAGKPNAYHQLVSLKNEEDIFYSSSLKDFEKTEYFGLDNRSLEKIEKIPLPKETVNKIYLKALIDKKECICIKGSEMRVEDELYSEEYGFIKIKDIQIIEKEETVYDLDIEYFHNYFANGILVHNSIYGFRGADPKNLELFKQEFNAQLIKIEKNYRSDAYILEAANEVIKNNTNRQGKNLVPTKAATQKIALYIAFNDEQESMFIANEMKRLRRTQIPFKEMAILYRTNSQSRSLEKALNAQGIPYIVYGGFRFFDRQEVKHAMAYLRLANNPHDNMAFLRVANIPARAIGETALKKLDVIATENKCSLYQAAQKLTDKERKKYQPFINVIDDVVNYCHGRTISDMTRIVIEHSGLEAMYKEDKKEGEERLDNLYELISAAEVFIGENKEADIDEFLAFSTLDSDMNKKKKEDNVDAVKLMTVHASKGLEFEAVFLTGLEESLFPHANSLGDPNAIEEERRLMYVALTRAKRALYMSYAEERLLHGQKQRFIKSRFLKEIPTRLLQSIN